MAGNANISISVDGGDLAAEAHRRVDAALQQAGRSTTTAFTALAAIDAATDPARSTRHPDTDIQRT